MASTIGQTVVIADLDEPLPGTATDTSPTKPALAAGSPVAVAASPVAAAASPAAGLPRQFDG